MPEPREILFHGRSPRSIDRSHHTAPEPEGRERGPGQEPGRRQERGPEPEPGRRRERGPEPEPGRRRERGP
jgi:hypothetical protein